LAPVTEGLARRAASGRGVDLTPNAWRATEASQAFKRRVVHAVVTGVFLWLLMVGAGAGVYLMEQRSLEMLQGQQREWNRQAMEVRDMRRRVVTIQRYTNQMHSALECLREVSASQTPGVELSSFSFRKGDAIRVAGTAPAVNRIYDFKRRLDESDLFEKTDLENVRNDPRKLVELFDLTIDLPEEDS
jgi:hypothetical protein